MNFLTETAPLLDRFHGLTHLQIAGIATGLLLQGAVFTIFPEEVVICALGIVWGQGHIGFLEALFATQLGLLPANLALVWIGKRLGRSVLKTPPFSWCLKENAIERAASAVRANAGLTIAITRFTPLIRGPVYFSAGLAEVGFWDFFRVDALASIVQITLLLLFGRELQRHAAVFLGVLGRLGPGVGLALALTVFWLFWKQSRKPVRILKTPAARSISMKNPIFFAAIVCALGALVQPTAFAENNNMKGKVQQSCQADIQKYCSDITQGSGRVMACLKAHDDKLSDTCNQQWKAAQAEWKNTMKSAHSACSSDLQRFCNNADNPKDMMSCLNDHSTDLSASCKTFRQNHNTGMGNTEPTSS